MLDVPSQWDATTLTEAAMWAEMWRTSISSCCRRRRRRDPRPQAYYIDEIDKTPQGRESFHYARWSGEECSRRCSRFLEGTVLTCRRRRRKHPHQEFTPRYHDILVHLPAGPSWPGARGGPARGKKALGFKTIDLARAMRQPSRSIGHRAAAAERAAGLIKYGPDP